MILRKLENHMQKNETRLLILYMKITINSKWIKDFTVRLETTRYIEETIGTKLRDLDLRRIFVNLIPKAREVKCKSE